MDSLDLMHKGGKRKRKGNMAGLRKARCVRSCKGGKLRARQPKKKTLTSCRRRCGVKGAK